MIADLSSRAVHARERMDAADADLSMLERTYARFGLVNAVVSGARALYRREVRPRAQSRSLRILDIGSGGGDLTRALAGRLRRDGLDAQITAVDTDPRAVRWARQHDDTGRVIWRCASSSELVHEGDEFDVILSNHVLHHLTAADLAGLLGDSQMLTAPHGVVIHSDIARSRAAYLLFAAATAPFAWNLLAGSFIRPDGLTSIRRSYTAAELAETAPAGWRVGERMPARLLLRWEAGDGRS